MRFSQLLPSVTHVVVGGGAAACAEAAAAPWRPHLVTVRWVLSSWRAGGPLPEADFRPPGVPPPHEEDPAAAAAAAAEVTVMPPEQETTTTAAAAAAPGEEEDTMLEATQTLFAGEQHAHRRGSWCGGQLARLPGCLSHAGCCVVDHLWSFGFGEMVAVETSGRFPGYYSPSNGATVWCYGRVNSALCHC